MTVKLCPSSSNELIRSEYLPLGLHLTTGNREKLMWSKRIGRKYKEAISRDLLNSNIFFLLTVDVKWIGDGREFCESSITKFHRDKKVAPDLLSTLKPARNALVIPGRKLDITTDEPKKTF